MMPILRLSVVIALLPFVFTLPVREARADFFSDIFEVPDLKVPPGLGEKKIVVDICKDDPLSCGLDPNEECEVDDPTCTARLPDPGNAKPHQAPVPLCAEHDLACEGGFQ